MAQTNRLTKTSPQTFSHNMWWSAEYGRRWWQWLLLFPSSSTIQWQTNHVTSHPLLETSPSSTNNLFNNCHSLWTVSHHWWQARRVSSQLHSPASRMESGWGLDLWLVIGTYCLVASPSPDRIIIVGGVGTDYGAIDNVEECAVVWYHHNKKCMCKWISCFVFFSV